MEESCRKQQSCGRRRDSCLTALFVELYGPPCRRYVPTIMPGVEKPKLTKSQFAEALARLDQVMEEAVRLRREITKQMAEQRAREPRTMMRPPRRSTRKSD